MNHKINSIWPWFFCLSSAVIVIWIIFSLCGSNLPDDASLKENQLADVQDLDSQEMLLSETQSPEDTSPDQGISTNPNVNEDKGIFKPTSSGSNQPEETADLLTIIKNDTLPEETRRQALRQILTRVGKEDDQTIACQILLEVKDVLKGEDLQSVLKVLSRLTDEKGNEAILETFFSKSKEVTPIERFRMLTYLNPRYPLSGRDVDHLVQAYQEEKDVQVRRALLKTLGTVCGDEGIAELINLLDDQGSKDDKALLLGLLGRSGAGSKIPPEYRRGQRPDQKHGRKGPGNLKAGPHPNPLSGGERAERGD